MSAQEARWVGPDPSGIFDFIENLERRVLYAAEYLADAIVDGEAESSIQMWRAHYTQMRAEARRVKALQARLYDSGAVGRFAGHLVRS